MEKEKRIRVHIKPSEITCDRDVFEEAEKCIIN